MASEKVISLGQLNFKDWKHISIREDDVSIEKNISSFFGRTYFRFDPNNKNLYAKTFNFIEIAIHKLFGYKSEYNKTNLWNFLKQRGWVQQEKVPANKVFREVVGKEFTKFCQTRDHLFDKKASAGCTEQELIDLFEKKGLEIDVYDFGGTGALYAALQRGDNALALYLLEHNASIPLNSLMQPQPLHLAVGATKEGVNKNYKVSEKVVTALLARGANIDKMNEKGYTALACAVERKDIETARLLLDKGANPNAFRRPPTLFIPLFLAINAGDLQLVRLLLDKRANLEDDQKRSAWDVAFGRDPHTGSVNPNWQPNRAILELLVDRTPDFNARDGRGFTPLHYAVERDYHEAAQLLMARGARPDIPNGGGKTPREMATTPEMRAVLG